MAVVTLHACDIGRLVERIRAEYLEMPGLSLTERQARRLWGLDETRCRAVLGALVDARFLARTPAGTFVMMADADAHHAGYRR